MKKYAKIVAANNQCEVGLGTDEEFYQSIGMEEMNVEQGWDRNWYVEGFAPVEPEPTIDEQNEAIRRQREARYVAETDDMRDDYVEAVARGSADASALGSAWVSAKDAIRAELPYVTTEASAKTVPEV